MCLTNNFQSFNFSELNIAKIISHMELLQPQNGKGLNFLSIKLRIAKVKFIHTIESRNQILQCEENFLCSDNKILKQALQGNCSSSFNNQRT